MHFDMEFKRKLGLCLIDKSFPDQNVLNAMRSLIMEEKDYLQSGVYLRWVRAHRPHLAYALGSTIAEVFGLKDICLDDDETIAHDDETKKFRIK